MDCDFDEYDYLEKSVDDAKVRRDKALPRSHHRRDRRREDGAAAAGTPDRNGAKTASSKRHRSERDKDRQGGEREHREREHRERDTRMEREKVRERPPFRGREFEREMGERENRRVKEKKEEVEPEADPERDQRTVFAYQMPLKATEKDIYEFFSKAGKVRDVRLILDRSTRRSKGVGYIEFYDAMSVPMAIAMSGHQLFGHPVMVKPSEAEKNLVQSNATSGSGVVGTAVARKIYVGNLHFNITEDQLRKVFEPFGQVELVQLPLDLETGQCKGYGFVQFTQVEHAKAALTLNGNLDIAGRIIKVSAVTDHFGLQDSVANAGSFDDDDGGGLSLNARSRALLMQKLDRTGTASSIVEALGIPTLNGTLPINRQAVVPLGFPGALASLITEPIGDPSEYVLLKNMFDPNTEMDPDFDLNIRDEVEEECSKFGPVKHIYVDKKSDGHVYLQFDGVVAATTCQRAMHKRWFARRSISATYMRPHEFAAKCSSDQ